MASTYQGGPASGSPNRSSGRGFAAVDPERQREVVEPARLPIKDAQGGSRLRRVATPEWFSPPRPSEEGGSCRRTR